MRFTGMLVVAVLLFAGCYESPLTKEHSIAVDSAVLGLWEWIPDEGEEANANERMMILKYSDTEYLIHYPIGDEGMYFRGYPIKIGDVSCVQIEVLGDYEGPPDTEYRKKFFIVASYRLTNAELEIKTLNMDLVDEDLKESEALKKAFLKHKDNKDLFIEPGKFRKVKS